MRDYVVKRPCALARIAGGVAICAMAALAISQPQPSAAKHGEQTPFNKFLGPWRVIGPIIPGIQDQEKRMAQPYLGLESGQPLPDNVTSGGETLTAKTVDPGLVNLGLAFERERQYDHAVAYADTVILSPDEREVLLSLGGDDGVIAWLNGQKVLENVKPNGIYIDDKIATVTLRAGSNHLLVKCDNIAQDWGFAARILPVGSKYTFRALYHIDPLPLALSNLPEAEMTFLNAAGEVLEKQTVSGWKFRGSPYRAGYIAHTTLKEEPARVTVEVPVPGTDDPNVQTFNWSEAKDPVVGAPGNVAVSGQVVDADTNAPLADATLSFNSDGTSEVVSGVDGTFQFVGLDPANGSLNAYAPGHFSAKAQVDLRKQEPITIRLKAGGLEIAGTVRDETGKPIAGAEISVSAGGGSRLVRSGADGKYSISGIQPSPRRSVYPVVKHPDYQPLGSFSIDLASTGTTQKDLVMQKGLAVKGRVTSPDGKPLAGVRVTSGEDDFPSNAANVSTQTDVNGNYRLGGLKTGANKVFAFHNDWAPAVENVNASGGGDKELNFTLTPGKPVAGTVVDPDGKPIKGVGLSTDTWRGARMFIRRTTTDDAGRFEIKHMPEDEVESDFYKSGFTSNRDVKLKGGDSNVSVTLQLPAKVSGRVVDAESGQPIQKFNLIKGLKWKNSTSSNHWEQGESQTSAEGKFSLTEDELSNYDRLLRIEADGYATWEYPGSIRAGDQVENLEVKLQRAQTRPAVVVDHAGKPVPGAKVHLFGSDRTLWLGQSASQSRAKVLTADATGKVALPQDIAPSDGLFAEKEGVGAVLQEPAELSQGPATIKLEPYGILTGAVFEGDEPQAAQEVVLIRGSSQQLQVHYETETDKSGRFRFDEIPTGDYTLAVSKRSGNTSTYEKQRKVSVGPGENPPELLGGTGGTRVYGRITSESGEPMAGMSVRLSNPAGQSFSAYSDAGGNFSFTDVPPSQMTISAQNVMRRSGDVSQYVSEKVEVPEAAEHRKDLQIIVRKAVESGSVFRSLQGTKPDGTTVTLADMEHPRILLLQARTLTEDAARDALTTVSAQADELAKAGIGIVHLVFDGVENTEPPAAMVAEFPAITFMKVNSDWVSDFNKRFSLSRDLLGVLIDPTGKVLQLVNDEQALKALKGEAI